MFDLALALLTALLGTLKSRRDLVLENLALRHQLVVLSSSDKRPRFSSADRLVWTCPYRFLIRPVDSSLCAGSGYPLRVMIRLLGVILRSTSSAFRTRDHLVLENLALRQQLSVLLVTAHRRPSLSDFDRAFWALLRRRWSGWKRALVIVQPETVVRWHRQGFKYYWRWKSRRDRSGRPGRIRMSSA